ncbi:hypothetical protein BHM03_00021049 [Ensete ventricosum]|nr:hypothetical protein BHM03_00021049 [Ensete ventricosum]
MDVGSGGGRWDRKQGKRGMRESAKKLGFVGLGEDDAMEGTLRGRVRTDGGTMRGFVPPYTNKLKGSLPSSSAPLSPLHLPDDLPPQAKPYASQSHS